MSSLGHYLAWLWTSLYQYPSVELDGPSPRAAPGRRSSLYKQAPTAHDAERGLPRDAEHDQKRIADLQSRNACLAQSQAALTQELDAARAALVGATDDAEAAAMRAAELAAHNAELEHALEVAHAAVRQQHTELARFRGENDTLRIERAHSAHALEQRAAEVRSLQSFLTKTDGWTGAEVIQAAEDLNAEIMQLAAGVADTLAGGLERTSDATDAADTALVGEVLGEPMLRLLATRDHAADPLVVQLALQAWAVHCCAYILDAFCTGLPPNVDAFLARLFERMHHFEPQPTSARWRSLAHLHARELLGPASSDLNAHTFHHARGVASILALAGCRAPTLSPRHAAGVRRLGERALALRRALSEDVMSACFVVAGTAPLGDTPFDAESAEDVFHGMSPPGPARVICATAFGVVCERRVERDAECAEGAVLERMVLLKPKVLLESIEELL